MSTSFSDFWDSLTAEELDALLEGSGPAFPAPAADAVRLRRRRRQGALAACVALALCLGAGSMAYAAESRDYRQAMAFFAANDLNAQGLTRGEVKAVYRDITTRSFTYAKTAEVLENSLSAQVPGFDILQESPTPEEMAALWDRRFPVPAPVRQGISYEIAYEDEGEKTFVEKRDGDTLLWRAPVTTFSARACQSVDGGVLVWGETWSASGSRAWLMKLDEDGAAAWTTYLSGGARVEHIGAVLEDEDGSYAVFSQGDGLLCLRRYSSDGRVTLLQKNNVGFYGIGGAARLGEGYLVRLGSNLDNEYARILKLDHQGQVLDDCVYGSEDVRYYVTDSVEYAGRVYLSARAVLRLPEGVSSYGGRDEIAAILDPIFSSGRWEIPSEELTPLVRANYTAVLLVCDRESGEPEQFYAVEGSMGGALAVSPEGELLWDVESITSTFFSPATSAFTIGGVCRVYRYAFDETGALLRCEKTDETTNYWK